MAYIIEPGLSIESKLLIEQVLKPKTSKHKKSATMKLNFKQGRRDKYLSHIQGLNVRDSDKFMMITDHLTDPIHDGLNT